MKNLPGYEAEQARKARVAKKQARTQARAERTATRQQIGALVKDSTTAEVAGTAMGVALCPAVFVWLVKKYTGDLTTDDAMCVAIVTIALALLGGFLGYWLQDTLRKRRAVHIAEKIEHGKRLNRVEQWELERLFPLSRIETLSHWYSQMFESLLAGNLSHISYRAALSVAKARIKTTPSDYARLKEYFNEQSIPPYQDLRICDFEK